MAVVVKMFGTFSRTFPATVNFLWVDFQVKQVGTAHAVSFEVIDHQVHSPVRFFPRGGLRVVIVVGLLLVLRVIKNLNWLACDLNPRDRFGELSYRVLS